MSIRFSVKYQKREKKIEGAQIAYVIIRRLTLAAFLTLAVLTAPSSFLPGRCRKALWVRCLHLDKTCI